MTEIYRQIATAEAKERTGVNVGCRWLRRILQERAILARLSADDPQLQELRNRVLTEEE